MNCPKCKEKLSVTKQERLETLSDHVSNPNGTPSLKNLWQCTNGKCECYMAFGWDDSGDFYSLGYSMHTNKVFPDGGTSALGSLARKLEVEVYGHGLPKKRYLHPIFMLYFFRPFIQWHGVADYDGNILEKWWTLGILKKDKNRDFGKGYCLHAEFCWNTWGFLWHRFKNQLDRKDFAKAFEPSYNKAWVYRWFHVFISTFYK